MRIAVVFDTPNDGWEDEEFKREIAAEVDEAEYEVAEALMVQGHEVRMVGVHDDLHHLFVRLAEFEPDLVFNCAEGFHERSSLDYVFPALLEAERYRYTGSPPIALLTTRNKSMCKKILAWHGVKVPHFVTYRRTDEVTDAPDLAFPLFVKPLQEDASEGIAQASVVQDLEGLKERVQFIHESFNQPAIAEEFVEGRELYVSVLGNGEKLQILPIIEMVFDKEKTRAEERIATKAAKWDVPYRERKGIKNVFARPLSQTARERIDEACRTAFRALWLRDYARVDVRLTPDDEPYVIEVNANPFISFGHDTANAAEKAGMDYYAFIERIVQEALARYEPHA
ncbi:MAG: ATP-grasp domain-containing protein [Gemmatimonadota bacterium]|nr:MAG: ATP-grasp domain-containing protein [Gemmatimonadota bacterium]